MNPETRRQPLIRDGLPSQLLDLDPAETQEWLESVDAVVEHAGANRARYILLSVLQRPVNSGSGYRACKAPTTSTPPAEPGAPVPR
jgi:pyruvate dehydrogenase complex dehydrogenase (E1) component